MEHELKIIMKCKDGEPITSYNTVVYLDDHAIGCIQDIKVAANVDETFPTVEITFPNFHSPTIDPDFNSPFIGMVDYQIAALSKLPNVKIHLKDIFNDLDETMDELGTDGHIESCITSE